jgi:hypothetical protein
MEALAMLLRPGNAGWNTACDQQTVIDRSLAQMPAEQIESIEILIQSRLGRCDTRDRRSLPRRELRFSFGYELTETVRTAILQTP